MNNFIPKTVQWRLLGAGALAGFLVLWASLSESQAGPPGREQLIHLLGSIRISEGRVTGGLPWAPIDRNRIEPPMELLEAARSLQRSPTRKSPAALASLGLLALADAHSTRAFELLEQAASKAPSDASILIDLSAALLAAAEADKKPAQMNDVQWTAHKAVLPQLYQQTAILHLVTGNTVEAKARLIKSTALDPRDPSSFALLGLLINDEYVQMATAYKSMPEGKQKEETLKKLQDMLDNIIDVYAHAAALAVGRPEYQGLMQQVTADLTSYYKFRHNQSTEGLQQLIDKYKPQP